MQQQLEWEQNEIFIKSELWCKIISEMGPWNGRHMKNKANSHVD